MKPISTWACSAGAAGVERARIGFLSLLLVVGPASALAKTDAASIAAKTTVAIDNYKKTILISAPEESNTNIVTIRTYCLRGGFGTDGSGAFVQIYFHLWSQNGWRFLDSAHDHDGNAFEVLQIDRSVSGSNIDESIAVSLTHDYLVKHKESGIDMQVSGKNGEYVLKLPPEHVQGFLQKFDETLTRVSFGTTPRAAPNAVTAKGSLGVNAVTVTPQVAAAFGTEPGKGMLIVRITEGSPAESAGIKPGDLMLSFGGAEVNSPETLRAAVRASGGDHVTAVLVRARNRMEVDVQLDKSESAQPVAPGAAAPSGDDKYAKLAKLKQLLDSGAITQDEFASEKAKILAQP